VQSFYLTDFLLQVYVSKNGQELSGRDAYRQYKKVKGLSILNNRKDAFTFSWFLSVPIYGNRLMLDLNLNIQQLLGVCWISIGSLTQVS
jgi:hypothetical protein